MGSSTAVPGVIYSLRIVFSHFGHAQTLTIYRKVAEVLSKDLLFPHSASKSQASSAAHRLLLNRHFLANRHKALCLSYKLSEVPALRPFNKVLQPNLVGRFHLRLMTWQLSGGRILSFLWWASCNGASVPQLLDIRPLNSWASGASPKGPSYRPS